MQRPVLLAADRLAILLDMIHRRLLAPIELKADLARKSKQTSWVFDQPVLNNFVPELLLLDANPG